ncbi:MAG: polyhydroxyalkanoate granule-associated phasin [Pseudomonadota bacterium]
MSFRSTRKAKSLATKSAELALAVPQVVAHRLARMAIAGSTLSTRDQEEFTLMAAEKGAAFVEAWQAMATQTVLAHQAMAMSFARSFWSLAPRGRLTPARVAAQLQGAALGVIAKGLAPVHRKATANAKRLARTKLR